MRNILVDLSQDRQDAVHLFGGFEGEHNASRLSVVLPERMKEGSDGEYRFVFETAKKEVIFSAPIEPEEGILSISLVKNLMLAPYLTAYVGCYRYENGEPVQIFKSGKIVLGIKNPEDGTVVEWNGEGGCVPGIVMEDSLLPDSDNPVKSRVLYTALEEKISSSRVTETVRAASLAGEKLPTEKAIAKRLEDFVAKEHFEKEVLAVGNEVYADNDEFENFCSDMKNSTASAFSFSAEGNPLRLDDVSPLEHEIHVVVTGEAYRRGSFLAKKANNTTFNLEIGSFYSILAITHEEANGELERVTIGFSATPLKGFAASLAGGASAEELLKLNELKEGDVVYYGTAEDDIVGLFLAEPIDRTVKKYGKNLFHYKDFIPYYNATVDSSKPSAVNSGTENATYLGEECFSYKAWGTADTSNLFRMDGLKENTQYTFSFEMAMDQYKVGPLFTIHYTDGTNETIERTVYGDSFNKYSYTSQTGKTVKGFRVSRSDATTTVYVKKNMQIEEGTNSTESEPYKELITYTADENGKVKGVTSLYPTTTLVADGGVMITAKYNRDSNKVVEKLEQKIAALSAAIVNN